MNKKLFFQFWLVLSLLISSSGMAHSFLCQGHDHHSEITAAETLLTSHSSDHEESSNPQHGDCACHRLNCGIANLYINKAIKIDFSIHDKFVTTFQSYFMIKQGPYLEGPFQPPRV